jgi:hypothetical protein
MGVAAGSMAGVCSGLWQLGWQLVGVLELATDGVLTGMCTADLGLHKFKQVEAEWH